MSDVPRTPIRLGFGWQIIALITFGILSLAVIGSITAAYFINKQLSNIALDQGRQLTATLAHQSILPLLSGVGENAREDVDSMLSYSNVRGIAIFDKSGTLLIDAGKKETTGVSDFPSRVRPFEPILKREREDVWEFVAAVYDMDMNGVEVGSDVDDLFIKRPELLGYVDVTIDRTTLYKIQAQLLQESLLIFIGIALVLVAIAVIISRQLTKPLHQLAGLMKRAEDGHEGIRASLHGPLEIHNMARAFNTMMDALEQRQTYAEEQHDSLVREIRERQIIEQDLRESEHRLVSIFNNVVDGILILDDAGVIESANPVAFSMLPLEESIVGKCFCDVINELSADKGVLIQADIGGLVRYCSSGHYLSIKGTDRPLEMDVKFSEMEIKGRKKYIAIVRDVTETLQQKRRIEALLAQHEAIVSSVPGLIMELDCAGKILWCNKHSEQVMGCPAAGLSTGVIGCINKHDQRKMEEAIASALAGGKAEIHAELLTAGGVIPYQFSMAHMVGVAGGESTLLMIGLDDSQSVMAQQALKKARDAALESVRIKSEFLANMSHEIRTPMNGMFGMLQLLSGSELNDEQKSYAEIALRSADQLLRIINDILDFSKIEAGKLELDRVEMSPRTVVEDAVELFSQRAQAKGVKLYAKVAVDVPDIIYGDPTRLNQIVSNLIGNAIKFTDHGHILVFCFVDQSDAGLFKDNRLVIRVEDTGIGIDPESQRRIFESFIQADGSSTRRYSGTGLGLAIVKQLVELMGGSVSVRSEPGRGSEFTVTLPLHVSEGEGISVASPILPEYRLARYIGGDEIAASILDDYLKSMGYRLETATPAQPLPDNPQMEQCDLYLIDYGPGSDELIARLSGKTSRVVVMMNQEEKSRLFVPPRDVELFKLVKPIRYHALHSCLRQEAAPRGKQTSKPASVEVNKIPVSQKVRILVVEDNETNLQVINSMLTKLGYSATSVRNGKIAVERAKQERFDIIFMDCQMPVMDGYQATDEIRRSERNGEHAVIIAMTGNAMEGDRERCLNAGMDDYIAKPVRLTLLQETLSKWESDRKKANPQS